MAHVVDCDLLNVDGHTYRVRTAIGRTPVQHRDAEEEEEEEMHWQEEEQQENEGEDLIDDSQIGQEGDVYVTRVLVDPEVRV